jgi:cell division transport system permease protein
LADRWGEDLARTSTIRITAPADELPDQTATALRVLQETPGLTGARALSAEEQSALLEPWFGPGLPVADLPIPQLIEVTETADGFDADALRLRLSAEVPGAVLDDHTRWRRPLIKAASRLRLMGWVCIFLIVASVGAIITLAANAALAANARVISVLRLVGATDNYIADAFVRRFTLRTLAGSGLGMLAGILAILLLPSVGDTGGILTGLGFQGWHWFLPLLVPPLAAGVALLATQSAARRVLTELS